MILVAASLAGAGQLLAAKLEREWDAEAIPYTFLGAFNLWHVLVAFTLAMAAIALSYWLKDKRAAIGLIAVVLLPVSVWLLQIAWQCLGSSFGGTTGVSG